MLGLPVQKVAKQLDPGTLHKIKDRAVFNIPTLWCILILYDKGDFMEKKTGGLRGTSYNFKIVI